jgi:hypothetical protein
VIDEALCLEEIDINCRRAATLSEKKPLYDACNHLFIVA